MLRWWEQHRENHLKTIQFFWLIQPVLLREKLWVMCVEIWGVQDHWRPPYGRTKVCPFGPCSDVLVRDTGGSAQDWVVSFLLHLLNAVEFRYNSDFRKSLTQQLCVFRMERGRVRCTGQHWTPFCSGPGETTVLFMYFCLSVLFLYSNIFTFRDFVSSLLRSCCESIFF